MQRRTAMITAASVAAVVLTAATAVSANFGILSSADKSPLGELTASVPVATTEPEVVDVYVDDPPAVEALDTATDVTTQEFAVDAAGFVELESTSTSLRVGTVTPNEGWTWTSSQASDTELMVTFNSGSSTLELVATLGPDGTVDARVDQPIVQTIQPAPTASAPTTSYSGDDHGDDHEEHEGRSDDD